LSKPAEASICNRAALAGHSSGIRKSFQPSDFYSGTFGREMRPPKICVGAGIRNLETRGPHAAWKAGQNFIPREA
jgi:hypothetical protein